MVNIFFVAFLASIIINIIFWLGLFSRLLVHKSNQGKIDKNITILVVFKNAKQYIRSCMSSLLSQNDGQKIIFVNDFSDDGSEEYAEKNQSQNLILYHARKDNPGKKSALQEGIRNVKTDLILLTDVDCIPASSSWSDIMSSHFNQDIDIVLGYSPVTAVPTFLNRFVRFETWMTALQYMSYAVYKIPYMGVGRNLAYRRSITEDFTHDLSILSGDDDLFVTARATSENTAICLDPDAFVYTDAKESWSDFYRQKSRHITTSHQYKFIHQGLLTLFSVSQMFVVSFALILIIISEKPFQIFLIFVIYMLLKWFLAFPLLKKFKEDNLFFLFPILDICFSFYYWIMAFSIFMPSKTWS